MKRGALVNLLIGITIALLPLYNRIAQYDFNRTSKDNLLVIILGFLTVMLPASKRMGGVAIYLALIYGLFLLVLNQWNVLSVIVMFQTFYIASAMIFFVHFYEKHDEDSIQYILNGMIVGALIQAPMAILGYFGIEVYSKFVGLFSDVYLVKLPGAGSTGAIGSLGNSNIMAGYLAITSLAFLSIKRKWLVVIPLIALFLTGSIMGIVSVLAGIAYYINHKINFLEKWEVYILTIMGMIAYPFTGIGHDSGRIIGWGKSLSLVDWHHFFIGKGAGWFSDQKIAITDHQLLLQEHNSFLSLFNVFGMAGFVLLAPLFVKFLNKQDENIVFPAILFTAFCNSYGNFTLHISTIAIIIIVTACICLAEGNKSYE